MNLTELKEAIDLINQFLESKLGQLPKNITDQLNESVLKAQREGFNRRRHLFLQHLKQDSIRVLCSSITD